MVNTTLLKLAIPLALIVIWQALALTINNSFILPDIGAVLLVLLSPGSDIMGSGSLLQNAWMSLERVCLGFLAAVLLAIPLGIAMGRSKIVGNAFEGIISALRPIPPLAWVPLALAWLKIGLASLVFVIALGAFFPVLLNTGRG